MGREVRGYGLRVLYKRADSAEAGEVCGGNSRSLQGENVGFRWNLDGGLGKFM